MSRVAKNPIEIVEGVDVNVDKSSIEVKGKIGEMKFDLHESIELEVNENMITVKYDDSIQQSIALAGTTRAIVNNMIVGVSKGFEKKLELKGCWL
jgi:large subunit ribosomal protein L6